MTRLTVEEELAALRARLPPAVQPYYSHDAANKRVLLCRAPVRITGQSGEGSYRGEYRVEWLPRPTVMAAMYGELAPITFEAAMSPETVTTEPELPPDRVPSPPRNRRSGATRQGSHWQTRSLHLEVGDGGARLVRGLLHLVNWPDLHGAEVRYPGGSTPGRYLLECDRWAITVDRMWRADGRMKAAAITGGYAMSHVAEVRRRGGETFGPPDLRELDEAASYVGSFAHGFRCGGVLPVGFDDEGRARWSKWTTGWVEGVPGAWSWLDSMHPEQLAELFPGFMARWSAPYWQRILRLAIRYYVETNVPSTIDLAIALAQVILEMLSHAWLVVERTLMTEEAFNSGKHPATRNIREMLEDMGIPTGIPERLSNLAGWRPGGKTLDGPWAIVELRNQLIHSRPQPTAEPIDYGPRVDAWKLATWYVELAILRLCGYGGVYRDRIRGEPYVDAVDPVPWAAPVSPA